MNPFAGFFLFIAAIVFCLGQAKADTTAEKVFGKWQRITIEEIRKPVPELERERTGTGAVTNEYRKFFPSSTAPKQVVVVNSNSLERR